MVWRETQPRMFSCADYVHVPHGDRTKLDKKTQKFRFIGYIETVGNYRLKQNCYICHDVIFNESAFKGKSVPLIEEDIKMWRLHLIAHKKRKLL